MNLKIYFLRHGETEASQSGTYCGSLEVDLTPEGYQMADDFAEAYKDLPWKSVFASPMHRTLVTAKPLCDALGIEMKLRDGLKEIAYGKWEGKMPEEVDRDFHDDYVRWIPDGVRRQEEKKESILRVEVLKLSMKSNALAAGEMF
jgi:broad specificity phosphatase PhoE